jgi:hypothetical protein
MVGFSHEDILLRYVGLLHPLNKRIRSVEHYIPAWAQSQSETATASATEAGDAKSSKWY